MIHRKTDEWIDNHYRTTKKAMLLTGARQVGKTYAVRRAAERFGWQLVETEQRPVRELLNKK